MLQIASYSLAEEAIAATRGSTVCGTLCITSRLLKLADGAIGITPKVQFKDCDQARKPLPTSLCTQNKRKLRRKGWQKSETWVKADH